MSSKTVPLTFDGFHNHFSGTIDESFIFSNFTDVTLVSEDGKHFLAHKIVLCASSPILSALLLNHQHQESFIYFQAVNCQELRSLLDYMYQGSVFLLTGLSLL